MKIKNVNINGKRIYNNLLSLKVLIITNKFPNWTQVEGSNNFLVAKEVVARISTSPLLLPTLILTILISKQNLYYTCLQKKRNSS